MKSLDDLLIERRRGTLTAVEADELARALSASAELELSLSAGQAFDRLETVLAGDAALLEQIVARAVRTAPSSPWLKLRWLLVLPLLGLVGTGAWLAMRTPEHAARTPGTATASALPGAATTLLDTAAQAAPVAAPQAAAPRASAADERQFEFEPQSALPKGSHPHAAPTGSAPAQRARTQARRASTSSAAAHEHPRSSESAVPAVPAAPAATAATAATVGVAPASPAPSASLTPDNERPATPLPPAASNSRELENLRALSARELFERGNQARKHDWLEAETLYELLLHSYPASPEASVAELTLAKRALAVGRAEDALRGFRRHRERAGDALQAEAAWGECQALEQLGRRSELRAAWQRLIEQHPDTSYAAVARRRLDALE